MRIAASLQRAYRRYRAHWRKQGGNIVAFSALIMVALVGMLALVIDIGFLAGQRRFMQNGADAAALAAARELAESVSPYVTPVATFPTFFAVNDATVRATATAIAQQNQNSGLLTRTTNFTVQLAYCVPPNASGYNYTTCPNWVSSPTGNGRVPDGAYMVRATVSSTITTLFGGVIGTNATSTTGTASAMILGVCPITTATGNIWPFTLWDQQNFGTDYNTLFQLWGSSNPPQPSGIGSSWKNVLDLTPAKRWCDGLPEDYGWIGPTTVDSQAGLCTPNLSDSTKNFTAADTSWNRNGYQPDPRGGCYTGTSNNPIDLGTWASNYFNGTLGVGDPTIANDGMKMPIFNQAGDGGQNVAGGIYGPANSCTSTYFFQNGTMPAEAAHPTWGVSKDVIVFTYDIPSGSKPCIKNAASGWTDDCSGANKLGRVTLIKILHFRIYRTYENANSRIWGRQISPVMPPNTLPGCGSGPSTNGNIVRMGQ